MARTPIYMPKFGMTMTEAYIAEWYVKEGQQVEKGDPLLAIETEKANADIEAPADGFIAEIKYKQDDTAPVGEIIGYVVDAMDEVETTAPVSDLPKKESTPAPSAALELRDNEKPFDGIRKQIADNMRFSLENSAQLTFFRDVDVDALRRFKKTISGVSYNDLLVKALALALKGNTTFCTQLIDNKLVLQEEIGIGLAVAMDHGLTVPVLHNVDRLSLEEIASERVRLVAKAREGKLEFSEMTGAVCTLTNLGTYGIDYFTPILNPPETAILGVGRIVERPWVIDGQVVSRLVLTLSLTVDHQLIDGASAAELMQVFCDLLGSPEELTETTK